MKPTTRTRRTLSAISADLAAAREVLTGLNITSAIYINFRGIEQLVAAHEKTLLNYALHSDTHTNITSARNLAEAISTELGMKLAAARAMRDALKDTPELAAARALVEPALAEIAALEGEEAAERNDLARRKQELEAAHKAAKESALAAVRADPALAEIEADLRAAGV